MYNKNYNLLFIHIPKTAGSSVSEYVYSLSNERFDKCHAKASPGFFKPVMYDDQYTHMPLKHYRKILTENEYTNSIKFTIVRNPISKLNSLYHYHIQMGWFNYTIEQLLPIVYYDLKLIESRGYALNYDDRSDMNATFNTHGILKQTEFFNINNDNINIIKCESLQEDFNIFTEKYNLPKFIIPKINVTHKKSITDTEFYSKLISNHPEDMISYFLNYYKQDFELLNYEFPT